MNALKPQLWPVIHFLNDELAIENARLAAECGCVGVFLIHMDGLDHLLANPAQRIKEECPELLVGMNFLSLPPSVALARSLNLGMDATWSDSPGVDSSGVTKEALEISQVLKDNPAHLFFGSVAFKYQKKDPNPALAAVNAHNLGMIPTTSGTQTGTAPDLSKLQAMREALGPNASLACASGIDPKNASVLMPLLSHGLVATGISKSFYEFDRALLMDALKASAP